MRVGVVGVAVAQLFLVLTISAAVLGETTSRPTVTTGDEVAAEDLALGQPAPTSDQTSAPSTPQVAPPPPSGAPSVTATQIVASPTLASTTVITNGMPMTASVDIRLLPKHLPYRDEPAMDGYVLDERRRWWMVIMGGALFGLGYVAAIVTGNEHEFDNGMGFTAIPIAGPWISMATFDNSCPIDEVCEDDEDSMRAQLAAGGLLQVAGAVLLPFGLMSSKHIWVRKDLAVGITPSQIGRSGYGALFSGTF
jgi:hypothetical protein